MNKRTLKDIAFKGKRALVRVDFNVPLDESGNVADDTRIRAALPTIRYILEDGGLPILISHLGRPKGKVTDKLKMDVVAKKLEELLGKCVIKLDDCVGRPVKDAIAQAESETVILLENVRFHPEEEKNDTEFAGRLSELAEVYVNDAFGTCHRAHASTEGVAHLLPSAAGLRLQKELDYFENALENPKRPFAVVLGGAKVSDKIGLIQNLLSRIDKLLIAGGMAYTFLKAEGKEIGNSIFEEDKLELTTRLIKEARQRNVILALPVDHIAGSEFSASCRVKTIESPDIPSGWMGLDIGPKTVQNFTHILSDCKTVIWNGPVGVSEFPPFSGATKRIAQFLGELDATTIIGGGDIVAAVKTLGRLDSFSHVSTGGGASLELLEGKNLPGVDALTEKE